MSKYNFEEEVVNFHSVIEDDENGRYKSWEYCYSVFIDARKSQEELDYDYLALQLAFYLASWGMYRGSSFLLKKDYKVHVAAAEIILDKKYDDLAGMKCNDLEDNWDKINDLYKTLQEHYISIRNDGKTVSSTLITKIIMGTLGCVPAYDRYFTLGVKTQGVTSGYFGKKSLGGLVEFYNNNTDIIDGLNYSTDDGKPYPQMKIIDMGFWEIGRKKDKEED